MIVVADTSPLCYLVLINEVDLARHLFSQVVVPSVVITELLHKDAPEAVRDWPANLPSWVSVQESPFSNTAGLEKLQVGEQAAIVLAESIGAELMLLDEKSARRIAAQTRPADYGHAGCFG